MEKPQRILYAEDNINDVELTLAPFEENEILNHIDIVHDGKEALDYLFYKGKFSKREKSIPDFMLLDIQMPGMGGIEVLKTIRESEEHRNLPQYTGLDALNELKARNLSIPFIFVTDTMNEEIAAGTIKEGAWDYVVKDRLFRLPFAMRSVLQLKEEKAIADKAEEKSKLLLTAIEQTSSQIIVSNIEGNIEYVNKKFTEVTGLTAEEAIGMSILSVFPDHNFSESNPESFQKIFKDEVFHGEIMSKRKDGAPFWELTSITPIKD